MLLQKLIDTRYTLSARICDGTGCFTHPAVSIQSSRTEIGGAVVLDHVVSNQSDVAIDQIDRIEPLHIEFDIPIAAWTVQWAAGGTSEHHYPPHAYRTAEASRIERAVRIESHQMGRSSNLHLPLMLACTQIDGVSCGFFCGLEWSGEWYIVLEATETPGRCRLRAGIKVEDVKLDPRESLPLPKAHIGFFDGDFDDGRNACRRYLYENVCARIGTEPMIPPVSYDHWFGLGNKLSDDLMRTQADTAKKLGVEIFVVDASWFEGDFPLGVGNWASVDRTKFPDGIEALAEYVRSLGMQFGLWFEPERAVEGTDAVLAHPEWYVQAGERSGKADYHINLAIPEAQDYLIETVGGYISRLDLGWCRWDYNIEPRPFWSQVDPTGKIQFAYMRGLYRVLDTLMERYPNWIVEGCASGGRRIDIGTIRRAHTFWFSDQSTDAALCRYMQARANCFLPGHLCNSSVAVAAGNGDEGFGDNEVLSRMLGKLAFDGDVDSWSDDLVNRMAGWSRVFKTIRHLLVRNFYQLLPTPQTSDDWDALQFSGYDHTDSIVFVFTMGRGGACNIRPKRLLGDRKHTVRRVFHDTTTTEESGITGQTLCEEGIAVELAPNSAGLWRIVAE